MPLRYSRYRGYRRTFKRRYQQRRRGRQLRVVRHAHNIPELKYYQKTVNTGSAPYWYFYAGAVPVASVPTNGNLVCLNTIGQGTTEITRNGNKIHMSYMAVKGHITAYVQGDITTLTGYHPKHPLRVMVLYDRQSNGAAIGTTSLFYSSATNNLTNAMYHPNYNQRYLVLYDKRMLLNWDDAHTLSTDQVMRELKFRIPLNLDATYSGTAADAYDYTCLATGGLWMCLFADDGIGYYGGSPGWLYKFHGVVRLRFYDS